MSNTPVATPVSKKRLAVFNKMTGPTKEVAQVFDKKFAQWAKGGVMIQYDLGAMLVDVTNDEAKFGSAAVPELAAYLNIDGGETTLYNWRTFAATFDKSFVESYSVRQNADGKYLTFQHWQAVMLLKEPEDQKKYLELALKNGLSGRELMLEVRAAGKNRTNRSGGRNPSMPASPIAGLQQMFQMSQKFNRWEEKIAGKAVFDRIDEMPADKIDAALLKKLNDAKAQIDAMGERVEEAGKRLDGNIERVEKVLEAKAETAQEPKEPKAVKEPKAAKASANGKAGAKKSPAAAKKPQRKPRRAEAATA